MRKITRAALLAAMFAVAAVSDTVAGPVEGVWYIVAAPAGCDGVGEPAGLLGELLQRVRAGYLAGGGTAEDYDKFLVDYASAISTDKQPRSVCDRDRDKIRQAVSQMFPASGN